MSRLDSRQDRCAGFTLVEVASVISILLIAILGFATSITGGMDAVRLNHENAVATQAARRVLERVQDYDVVAFEDVFASFNTPDTDDPNGSGSAEGPNFAVDLPIRPGDTDGLAGRIEFPTSSDGRQLREDVAALDLNSDGSINNVDRANDYRLLPITVRIEWFSRGSNRELALTTILANR